MTGSQDWSDIFAPDGRILQEGETIRRTNLSRTLDLIAREGAKGFYQAGRLARIATHSDRPSLLGTCRRRNCEQGSGNRWDSHA